MAHDFKSPSPQRVAEWGSELGAWSCPCSCSARCESESVRGRGRSREGGKDGGCKRRREGWREGEREERASAQEMCKRARRGRSRAGERAILRRERGKVRLRGREKKKTGR
eukprot:1518609-Rhodomonas_salina.1